MINTVSFIPGSVLKQLYTRGSLQNNVRGFQFEIKNRLSNAQITAVHPMKISSREIANSLMTIMLEDGRRINPDEVNQGRAVDFPLRHRMIVAVEGEQLSEQQEYLVEVSFTVKPFGKLSFSLTDNVKSSINQE